MTIPDGMKHHWWLVELDRYGNPSLCDGPHGERSGAERALYILQRLGSAGCQFAVAEVYLSDAAPRCNGVDEEALNSCVDMIRAAKP
jgi:hypothetical protein